ncbi:MAG: hypothetical protein ABF449_10700 [Ethanoligenens sp.]
MSAASSVMRKLEGRMAEIAALQKHIANYSKTRKTFDALHAEKIPTMDQLQEEYTALLGQKKARYEDYRRLKDEQYELQTVRRNVDQILRIDLPDSQRKQERQPKEK